MEEDKLESQCNMNKRILFLDGIKGISCFFVFFHHFMLRYFPASYYGAEKPSLLYGVDTFLSTSPLGFIVNGNFFVHLFILISGYVVTSKCLSMPPERIAYFHIRRYLKLLFPLLISSTILFFIKIINMNDLSLKLVIKEIFKFCISLTMVFFHGDTYISGVYWMLNYIFLGGIFVSLIAALCWIADIKKVFFIPCFIGIILFLSPSLENIHWATLFWGCALCLFNTFYKSKNNNTVIFIIVFFVGLFLGGFPSGVIPTNIYKYFILSRNKVLSCFYWHSIAATLFIFAVLNSIFLQEIFQKKLFIRLSKISLWVYLLHSIARNCSNSLLNFFYIENHIIKSLLIFFCSTIILFVSSYLCQKFLTPFGNKVVNFILDRLTSQSKCIPEN